MRVRVKGLQARPDLNGCLGSVVEWDAGEGRWKVLMDDGSGKMLRASNLEECKAGASADASAVPAAAATANISSSPDDSARGPFLPGQQVQVKGLQARPDLNGSKGTVVEWDSGEARWKVRMEDGSGKMFKPSNIDLWESAAAQTQRPAEFLSNPASPSVSSTAPATSGPADGIEPGMRVRVKGLQARPDLNGCLGSVVEWDAGEGRWKVLMDDGSGLMLRASNLEVTLAASSTGPLVPGQRVRVAGLQARPELNGREGTVVEWDEDEARWKVIMDDGSGKKCKPSNLEICEAMPPETDTGADLSIPASPSGSLTSLRSSINSLPLDIGARVRVKGLRMRPELNGCMGTVLKWDAEQSRWNVIMDNGNHVLLRRQSLEIYAAALDPQTCD